MQNSREQNFKWISWEDVLHQAFALRTLNQQAAELNRCSLLLYVKTESSDTEATQNWEPPEEQTTKREI